MLQWETLGVNLMRSKFLKKRLNGLLSFLLIFTLIFTDIITFISFGLSSYLPLDDYLGIQTAEAGVGDFSIFRENTGTETIPTTTPAMNVQWDTTVSENSNIILQSNNSDIDLADGGKYLVMYNVWTEQGTSTAGTNRRGHETWLTLGGTELEYGRSTGYLRDSDNTIYSYNSGAAIVDATAGDDLEVQVQRFDTNSGAGMNMRGTTNGVSVLKLKDSWDYLRIRRGADTGDIDSNTSFTDLAWDASDEVDTDSFDFTPTSGNITLKGDDNDHFLVTANVHFNRSANNTRENYEMRLTLDGAEIPGTRTTTYLRGDSNSNGILDGTLSYVGIIRKDAIGDQTLNLEYRRESSASGGTTIIEGGKTAISIVALPDEGSYVMLTRNATSALSSSRTAFPWNTQQEVDSAAFSHSTTSNPERINIDAAGDYLFFSTMYAVNSSNERQPPRIDWEKSGSLVNYGGHGSYIRGSQSFSGGSSGGLILNNLGTSDYIEVTEYDETEAPINAEFQSNRVAVQGVLLDQNFWGTDAFVTATGTQTSEADIVTSDLYVGGLFAVEERTSSRNVTGITITESGSVDAANGLDNIKLFYEYDTTSPYDCGSESYAGTETQYGSTDTNGFSGADGSSSFTDTVTINTTQTACFYVVSDITASSTDADTIDISINNPTTDVTITGGGTLGPTGAVDINGSTTLRNAELTQIHYNWRNDDGSETTATSIEGTEDTSATGFANGTTRRLRLEVSAEGSTSSAAVQYRLEYGQKITTCAAISSWTDVGTGGGGDWDVVNTANLTDGNNTTNVASQANGGVTDENTTFLTTNGAQKDTSSQTGSITLTNSEFVELEYAIEPTAGAPQGNTYCFRLSDAGTPLRNYDVYPEGTISADIDVSASSSQVTSLDAGSTAQYVGGTFVIERSGGTRTLTSITITETGTIDAQNNLDNIEIYYDVDNTSPYDCTGEVYNAGSDPQWGTTDTDGFSAANGSSTFTGSQSLNNTNSFCGYVVFDVGSGASNGETIEVQIADPSSDVIVTSSSVGPSTAVSPTGSTTIAGPVLTQEHYHWRNDDGNETGATSASGGSEDTVIIGVPQESIRRLRLEVSNEGTVDASATNFRLEYGTKVSTCANVSTWTDVGAVAGAWDMALSSNIADGNTTNIVTAGNGAVTDGNITFDGVGALRETSSESGAITLSNSEFTELEYSIEATTDSAFDTTYCFRVTDSGTPLPKYDIYPELTTREKQDFYIQRGTEVITGASTTLVAGIDYITPAASTSAFVRITTTQLTGGGNTTGGGNQNTDDITAYILDPWNIENSFVIQRPTTATAETRVSWEIIEYIGIVGGDNEMIVRQNSVIAPGSGALVATGTAATGIVDDSDVVVFITGQSNDNDGTVVNTGLYTSHWATASDEPVFTRGATGDTTDISYAVVEFTGANWKIQRVEHNYSSATAAETESIAALNSLSRTFVHAQKRVASNGLDETGQEVWLSSVGFVSFQLQSGATTPAGHYGVAWVLENTQIGTGEMSVQRTNGSLAIGACGGAEPCTEAVSITTVNAENTSPWVSNRSSGAGTAFPRPMVGVNITTDGTQIEYWRSDTGQTQTYRTEIVEWPVAETSVRQNYYRFYVDNDLITPTDPWPVGATDLGENTTLTGADDPLGESERVRIRMSFRINNATLPETSRSFKLQYGLQDTTCSAITVWTDVGDPGSGAIWRGYNGSLIDGAEIATSTPASGTLLLTPSDVAGTYEEQNSSAVNPYSVDIGEDVEYDWIVEHNGAAQRSDYCFRAINNDDTELDSYINYPTIRTTGYTPIIGDWRWFGDETNQTPTSPLAVENVAPVDIVNTDEIKLRVLVAEVENAAGTNIKFGLQYSQYADFSDGGTYLVATSSCVATSTWCYADGGGIDNAVIQSAVLTNTDSCSGGVGNGCGVHNEAATTSSTLNQPASSNMEFEFTLQHAAARANGVYYFRLFDVVADQPLVASSSYPSLVTEGAQLVFTVSGVDNNTVIGDITTDATSTATSIDFGSVIFDTDKEVAQDLSVNTNATEGYQVLMFADQQLENSYGTEITPITSSNAAPAGWGAACTSASLSCFGYHTTDATLAGGSGRFAPVDSYAPLATNAEEVMYSSVPGISSENLVYRIRVTEDQVAGDYETSVTYVVVPVF